MKTKEELNALKEEVEVVRGKLRQLTEEELDMVTGGIHYERTITHTIINTVTDEE